MIKVFVSLLTFVLTAILLLGCSGSSNNKGNDGSKIMPKNRIHWESISSDFNPSIVDTSFKTAGLEQINIDIFNFTDDVEVVYSDELHQDEGGLRLYKVWKKSASWGISITSSKVKHST